MSVFSSLFARFLYLFLKVSDITSSFPPPLSAEEERACFIQFHAGDRKARERLISHNLRLVAHIIKKYYSTSKNQEDLLSIGTLGLIKAIDNFDSSLNVKFSTYAVPMIIGEIRRYLRDNNSIRVSRSVRDLAYKALQIKEEIEKDFSFLFDNSATEKQFKQYSA